MMDSPKTYTPKEMARFSRLRIRRIERALLEIAGCYGDVDQGTVDSCDYLIASVHELQEVIDDLESIGASL